MKHGAVEEDSRPSRAMAEVTDGIKKCQDWAAGR